jgi:hypothetical protein
MRKETVAMRTALATTLASSFVILLLVGVRAAQEPSERPNPLFEAERQHKVLAPIMDKKLRYTHRLITSLAIEDFQQMALDARELKLIGETTLMKVSPNLEYVRFSTEFSSVVEELGHRAKAHDLNGATLSYIRLTMNCVDCHKYVRDTNILGRNR